MLTARWPATTFVFALALVLDACGAPQSPATPANAPRELADFCRDHPCQYEAYRARVMDWRPCSRGEAGTCGDLRYVEILGVDGYEAAYFAAAGNVVWAETSGDVAPGARYGIARECEKKPAERLCGGQ